MPSCCTNCQSLYTISVWFARSRCERTRHKHKHNSQVEQNMQEQTSKFDEFRSKTVLFFDSLSWEGATLCRPVYEQHEQHVNRGLITSPDSAFVCGMSVPSFRFAFIFPAFHSFLYHTVIYAFSSRFNPKRVRKAVSFDSKKPCWRIHFTSRFWLAVIMRKRCDWMRGWNVFSSFESVVKRCIFAAGTPLVTECSSDEILHVRIFSQMTHNDKPLSLRAPHLSV